MSYPKCPEFQQASTADVVWWIALWMFDHRRPPSAKQIRDRFGMSEATSHRYAALAREKHEQMMAREGRYDVLEPKTN
ncbi:hypothetical protein [Frateuria sp. YIM B11624]|uniref:hypothetical protein n=1 Tax=Frateuria sp. YIM B11624 TaxID=3143185 RepID=UPI003C76425A